MELTNLSDALKELLAVSEPWQLGKINLQRKNKVVDVFVNFKKGSKFICSSCGKECKVYDTNERRWRHQDLFEYRCYLNIKVPRTDCSLCGVKVINQVPWGRINSHYSFFFEQKIMSFIAEMSMSAVSKELGEPDNNLWRVFNHYIKQGLEHQIELSQTKRIAVDETAQKRGHNYVTIFTDLDTGEVILVEPGRKKEVFSKLYGWLFDKGGHPKNIDLFSMDMSQSYKAGRKEYFPNAEVCFDKFHIKSGVNEALDKVRKEEVKYTDELKNTKYIWLKNEQNLTAKQRILLNGFLVESTSKTAEAYKLRLSFDQLWQVQKSAAESLLNLWMQKAIDSTLKPFKQFVGTLINNYDGVLKSITSKITNAVAEGLNSKMQLARSRARGYRNTENFMNMIYFLGNDFIFFTH